MTEIVIFGGLHDGLDHRQRFQDALRAEIRSRRTNPTFVAVEWREGVYRALTAERQWLEDRLRRLWRDPAEDVVRLAGESLCWEADAHVPVLAANTPVVYLDGLLRREADDWAIHDPQDFLSKAKSAPLITAISREAAKSVDRAVAASNAVSWPDIERKMPERRDRDRREPAWADAVSQQAGGDDDRWAVAVVGAVHGTRFDRYSFPCQLDGRRIRSTAIFLTQPPWAGQNHCDRE